MSSTFRRMSKSAIGTVLMALILLMVLVGFALGDVQNVLSGGSFGMDRGTLAEAGSEEVTERDLSSAMQLRLNQVRQQNPEADYAALAGDFGPVMEALIQERALKAFASGNGIELSRRLVDAEIAKIPATRGLDGRFSPEAYAQFLQDQRLTDVELRSILAGSLVQRLLLAPAGANARIPVGIARPYASMLLEAREAEVSLIPVEAFLPGIPNPADTDIQQFYAANRNRYMVPEQRVLNIARIGPEQVANVTATDKEIEAHYKANQATYGGKAVRLLTQAIIQNEGEARATAQRARSSGSLGSGGASIGAKSREEFVDIAGEAVAGAVFAAQQGAIVGPIRSDLGWHVVKVDAVRSEAGRSLASARGEIAEALNANKRKEALADLVGRIEDSVAEGASFAEAIRGTGAAAVKTPAITAGGVARAQPDYKLPPELATALRAGFELGSDEEPVVETLPGDAGYALVGVDEIIAAAPAPLASIRDQVARDWKAKQASDRARAVASAIAAKVAKGEALRAAVAGSGAALPPVRPVAMRRLQLSQMQGNVPPAIGMVFSLAQGRSRMIADPRGRGFIVVKVNKITPGDARLNPGLISRTQQEFQQTAATELAEQMSKAIEADVGVKRNEEAIAAARRRITGGGS